MFTPYSEKIGKLLTSRTLKSIIQIDKRVDKSFARILSEKKLFQTEKVQIHIGIEP